MFKSSESPDDPTSSSLVLEELRRDDASAITFSYYSTASTNQTMSNLIGAGRIIGNLLSKAGLSLESGIGKFAYRTGIGNYAKAAAMVQGYWKLYRMFEGDDAKKHAKACELLLIGARSNNSKTQTEAFTCIVHYAVIFPSVVRLAFQGVFQRRNEISDVVSFSWRRSGVDYDVGWLYWYKLASRCLSSQPSPILDAAAQFDSRGVDFSQFEDILLNWT
ncbi:hypothetical protein SCHPADRAFT_514860 [Schizopora paradoxa]|uniref:Uncharacterized protein n=1 Tax=Schizopora paradoxa TaxID=27342 RepID=A0A0H2RG23_9AGAM|nr:hypothetical protein SCHPADRAFT_514860 [Schizopora paradoxa]